MALPLFKVLSLVIRVFSKPVLNYAKKASQNGNYEHTKSRYFFIRLGKFYNKMETKVN